MYEKTLYPMICTCSCANPPMGEWVTPVNF